MEASCLKAFCFLLLNASWPLYQNAGRNCIAGDAIRVWRTRRGRGPCHCTSARLPANVVEMALWWGIDGKEGGVLARGGWLLPVGWTVNTGFYLFLETAFPVEL